ncbi:hypothetical protein BU15DRAFT_66328 [Melanogaster broomeanus]|nr:hypothetical protein BU15DRAFT_66328 [Melanogaster broomeanus]
MGQNAVMGSSDIESEEEPSAALGLLLCVVANAGEDSEEVTIPYPNRSANDWGWSKNSAVPLGIMSEVSPESAVADLGLLGVPAYANSLQRISKWTRITRYVNQASVDGSGCQFGGRGLVRERVLLNSRPPRVCVVGKVWAVGTVGKHRMTGSVALQASKVLSRGWRSAICD